MYEFKSAVHVNRFGEQFFSIINFFLKVLDIRLEIF